MKINLFQLLKTLIYGQSVWLLIILILSAIFTFGEVYAVRLFTGTETENWSPSGSGSHSNNSTIHHK